MNPKRLNPLKRINPLSVVVPAGLDQTIIGCGLSEISMGNFLLFGSRNFGEQKLRKRGQERMEEKRM